jgi:hypothetical protein
MLDVQNQSPLSLGGLQTYALLPMRTLLVMLALIVVAVALGVFVRRSTDPAPAVISAAKPTPAPRVEEEVPASVPVSPEDDETESRRERSDVLLAPPLALDRGTLPWEEKIESVLRDGSLSNAAKARRLVSMFPELPADGLATAAEECVERLPDADYNAVALPVIASPQTHGAVANVLFADLMERPDAITLPALLRIAQIPNHSYAKFAKENLRLLLDEDFGSDWPKWDAAIRVALSRKGE